MALIKNTLFYSIGTILPKIGAFIFLPLYLKHLSAEEYGIISSLSIIGTVLVIIFTLSIPRSLYRLYYDYSEETDKKRIIGSAIFAVSVIAIVNLILLLIFRNFVGNIFKSIEFYPYFFFSILAVFFISLHTIPQTVLQIKERASTFITINISLFIFKNLLILLNVVYLKKGALGYLQADMIADILFVPIYYLAIKKYFVMYFNWQMIKKMLVFSLPIIPGILSAWILNLSDRIFIEHYFTTSDVGVYSLGYQIAGLTLLFTSAFKSAYDPYFYKIANTMPEKEGKMKLYRTNNIFLILLIFITFNIAFFSDEIIAILFDDSYSMTTLVVPIVCIGYLFSQNSALLNVMAYQHKKTKSIMYITILSGLLNILLNVILIPKFGIIGAAWSSAFSFLFVFIITYFTVKKYYFIPFNWAQLFLYTVFFIGIYFLFKYFKPENNYISILIKLLFTIVLSFFVYQKNKSFISSFIKK